MHVESLDTHTTAALVDEWAHAARNHVATVLAAARLVDDAEVAAALRDAGTALLRTLDRTIAAARVELGLEGQVGDASLRESLHAAARRAAREGWAGVLDEFDMDGEQRDPLVR